MNQPTPEVTVETLSSYSFEDAAGIGKLMPHLSSRLGDEPIDEKILRDIIASPYHDQLVARDEAGTIIGTATLSITMAAGVGRGAYLEDFVVSPHAQGAGIGSKLWSAMISWCEQKGAHKLDFTSSPSKKAAQHFYQKHGAVVRDTNHFRKTID